MHAVAISERGDAGGLTDVELPDPALRPRDLLVRVRAVGVNPLDIKLRRRARGGGRPRIAGFDVAGTVEAVAAPDSAFAPGDEVYYAGSVTRPGATAQLHAVDESLVARKPASLSFAEAAALPLATITAWESLFHRLSIPRGAQPPAATLLVTGGGGGVGSMVVQLARALTDLRVIATASRPATRARALEMGAHEVADHGGRLCDALAADTVDHVVSTAATDAHLASFARLLKPYGAVVVLDEPGALDPLVLKRKSIALHWESVFTPQLCRVSPQADIGELLAEVADLVDAGAVRSPLGTTLAPLDAATLGRAHQVVESGAAVGRVVVTDSPARSQSRIGARS